MTVDDVIVREAQDAAEEYVREARKVFPIPDIIEATAKGSIPVEGDFEWCEQEIGRKMTEDEREDYADAFKEAVAEITED